MGGGCSASKGKLVSEPQKGTAAKYVVSSRQDSVSSQRTPLIDDHAHEIPDQTDDLAPNLPSQAEIAETLAVLETARAPRLRTLPPRVLRKLAEVSEVEEHSCGSEISGDDIWLSGTWLVISGAASVVINTNPDTANPNSIEIAVLQKGDSFGFPVRLRSWPSAEEEAFDEAWERCFPRILVTSGAPLRLSRLEEEEAMLQTKGSRNPSKVSQIEPARISRHQTRKVTEMNARLATHNVGEQQMISERFAQLWLTVSPPVTGIGELPAGMPRVFFKVGLWVPLLDRLDEYREEIRRRQERGYRIHDRFPLAGRQIGELTEYILQTTEIWYGSKRGGNLSTMYRWFTEAMDVLGVTAYHYENIPKEPTLDGWATVVDGAARAAALKGKGKEDNLYVATGGLAQRQGRSAIDNTVLRNVFLPSEARELLVGRRLRKFLCKVFAVRQRCILTKLSNYLCMDLLTLAQEGGERRGHRLVRAALRALPLEEIRAAGVDPDSICLQELRARGTVISGMGQLRAEEQLKVWEQVRSLLQKTFGGTRSASSTSEDIWERYVAWCQEYPGDFFEHNKQQHLLVKISGMFSRRIIVVKRSVMEKMTLARYFPLGWRRTQPLWGGAASGPFKVRSAGPEESSNVRANECPYAPLHGMSLSAGSFASDRRSNKKKSSPGYTLLTEMQWVSDPSANIENWYIIDIEKIVQEAWQLNPHGPTEMMLEGEIFVNVGQNPKVGSSIKQTQHTQLCHGSLSNYKVLQMASPEGARFSAKLNAMVDVINVAPEGTPVDQCGLMVKICTPCPTSWAVLSFLVELRHHLLVKLSGDSVDFLVLTLSDERGGFVVTFAPIPQLVKIGDEHPDLATWVNPLTGESSDSVGLEETRIDFGKGVGHFLVAKPALRTQILQGGEEMVRRIWAFNRIPGLRVLVDNFIRCWLDDQVLA